MNVEESVNTASDREIESVLDNLYDLEGKNRCQYCGRLRFRLYSGVINLYYKGRRLTVLVDIDHTCEKHTITY